jgi:uncharacterized protein (DUF952 family)
MTKTRPMTKTRAELVFKICREAEWAEARESGCYTGSGDDARDGFIHLSTAGQLVGTAGKYFRGIEGLVLVAFEPAALGEALKWEPSRGGALFPHLYAPLPVAKALWASPLPLAADGVPVIPKDIVS